MYMLNFDDIWLVLSQYISYVSVDDLHVLQETIVGIFTRQTFNEPYPQWHQKNKMATLVGDF